MSFSITKRQTKDIGAGVQQLLWECDPGDPPEEFLKSPVRTPFVVTVHETATTPPCVLQAMRMLVLDRGNGLIGLQLIVNPGDLPNDIAYAKNGAEFTVDVEPAPYAAVANIPITPEDRLKVLKRIIMLSRDPMFVDYLRTLEDGVLIDECERADPKDVEIASVEVVLRQIRAQSRSDIVHDTLIADRAEELMRSYRRKLYKDRDAR